MLLDRHLPPEQVTTAQSACVVHVITRLLNAGSEENTVITCNAQVARGMDVWLVHGPEYAPEMLAKIDPRVRRHVCDDLVRPVSVTRDARAVYHLAALFRRIGPTFVHTHTSKAGIVGRVAARIARVPYIIHGVHILPFFGPMKPVYVVLERACARFTDVFIDVSAGMRDAYLGYGIGTDANHVVVASGMDVERFAAASPDARVREAADRAVGGGAVVAAMVAAFEPRKRHAAFLHAVAPLMKTACPKLVLVFAGEGSQREAVERVARELGIAERVLVLGFRPDVERIIAAADVCVLTSELEGLPRVAVQYALGGRPMVLTDLPGIGAVARDGVNAAVVPVDRMADIARAVVDLALDADRRERMGAANRSVDLSPWSDKAMVSGIESAYQMAVAWRPADGLRYRRA